jgi:glucose/arabinose dehydrogenase
MTIFRSILISILFLPLVALAQLGDKKDGSDDEQVDPIPADQIPPAPFLSVAEAMQAFELADGFVIEPVATEPLIENPVAIAFDANGRMWVAEMRSYMPDIDGNGEETPNGRIRILEDTNGDGKMDKSTDFLSDLVLPRLVAFSHGGVIFNDGDALYYIKRDGLKPVGKRELIDAKYALGGNPEHKANGMLYGHDNWFYNANSTTRYRRIDGKWIQEKTANRGQFGISKDNVGRLFYNSNSTLLIGDVFTPGFLNKMRANQIGSNEVYSTRMNPGTNRAYRQGSLNEAGKLVNATGASGPVIYRGDNFPDQFSNYAFVCEPTANLVKAIELTGLDQFQQTGTHPYGEREFLTSTDERFRPVNSFTAPDGTLIIADMYHGLIQHKAYVTSYLRKQYKSRDLDKHNNNAGRIYSVRWKANPASKIPALEGKSTAELLPYLSHPNGFWRDTAQRLIVESGDISLAPKLTEIASNGNQALGQIHALWTLEGLGQVNSTAINAAFRSNDTGVRMTAFELAPTCRKDSISEVIASCINTPDNDQVYKARCLTRLGDERAWKALLEIIEHPVDNELILETVFFAATNQIEIFQTFLAKQGRISQAILSITHGCEQGNDRKKYCKNSHPQRQNAGCLHQRKIGL